MALPTAASPATELSARETSRGLLAASVAVTTWGASGIIAKWLPQGGLAVAAYRFGSYFVIVGLWQLLRRHQLTWTAFKKSIPGGIFLAADVALFFSAIKLTTVVNATIVGALQPLLLTVFGVRFLGESVKRRDVLLGLLALAGVVVIVVSGSDSGESSLLGDLCAVGALFAWSGYFVFAKRAKDEVSPTDYTLAAAFVVAIINAPLALVVGQSLAWPAAEDWLWLLVMALGAGILGHNLMNWSIVRIPLWLGSTFTLLVPVVSSALAWVVLDEPLNAVQILAMACTVAAIAVLVRAQTPAGVAARARKAALA